MNSDRTFVWIASVIIVLGLVFGIIAFKSCYDDHRNELGFSRLTSFTSCSGG